MQQMPDEVVESPSEEIDIGRAVMIGIRQNHQIDVLIGFVEILDHPETLARMDVVVQQTVAQQQMALEVFNQLGAVLSQIDILIVRSLIAVGPRSVVDRVAVITG